jgi:hypothetical protein
MSKKLSIEQTLTELRKQVAYHREREAYHAEQEATHQAQRISHAAERQAAEEMEKAVAAASEQVQRHQVATAPRPSQEGLPPFKKRPVGPLVNRLVESYLADATFSPEDVAREVNRNFAGVLKKPVGARDVSVPLRRLAAARRIFVVQKGTPYHGAVYSRTRP